MMSAQIKHHPRKAFICAIGRNREEDLSTLHRFTSAAQLPTEFLPSLEHDLLDTIRAVYSGQRRVPAEVASELAQHAMDDALTEREIEVLKQVAAGCSNKVVAERLLISEDTVKGHVRNILSKLEASDRTHAVTIALRRGYFDL
jgi:DNA-binding NarL/FixJ family response regulator